MTRLSRICSIFGLVVGLALASGVRADDKLLTSLTVSAPRAACRNTPVRFVLSADAVKRLGNPAGKSVYVETLNGKEKLPCQVEREKEGLVGVFVLPGLPKGGTCLYRLRSTDAGEDRSAVHVVKKGGDLEIRIGDALFTTYTTHMGPNKPFFYPILTPDGHHVTRQWPMEQVAGESHDHPHHRGLWFTHGSVNGIDFWSEGNGTGKTLNVGYEAVSSGPVYGSFRALTDWATPDNERIASDVRTIRVYALPDGDRLLDFEIAIAPAVPALVFGDTKEGMFGLRTADSLAPARKEGGHCANSNGLQDAAVWAKPADWVDYFGSIGGKTYGVAIFDHPSNLRHPETWHARDYGLFAVNPFGLHDFGLGNAGVGNYILPKGKTLVFRYRILFHRGNTTEANVATQYAGYAAPPDVQVR